MEILALALLFSISLSLLFLRSFINAHLYLILQQVAVLGEFYNISIYCFKHEVCPELQNIVWAFFESDTHWLNFCRIKNKRGLI